MDNYTEIVPAWLTPDELNYELKIRGALGEEPPSERVEMLNNFLKGPLNPEKSVRIRTWTETQEKEELLECSNKVLELQQKVAGGEREELCTRLRSRVIHMSYRLKRNIGWANRRKKEFEVLMGQVQDLMECCPSDREVSTTQLDPEGRGAGSVPTRQDTPVRRENRGAISKIPLDPLIELEEGEDHTRMPQLRQMNSWPERIHRAEQRKGPRLNVGRTVDGPSRRTEENPDMETHTYQGLPIHQWRGVQFNGAVDQLSRFLVRVRQFAEAEGATEHDLFRNRVHLFTGAAADWLATRPDIRTWGQLVDELVYYTRNTTSDLELLEHIRAMRQGEEPTNTYITRLELAIGELRSSLQGTVKVELIIGGMRPNLRQALAANFSIQTVDQLREAARRFERMMGTQAETGSEPTRNKWQGRAQTWEAAKLMDPARRGTSQACFKCGKEGHRRVDCPQLACFGCGRPNTRRAQCPTCQGNRQGEL